MNTADHELFKVLECLWVNYYSKCERGDDILHEGKNVLGMVRDYGTSTDSGKQGSDKLLKSADDYRHFGFSERELFAAKVFFAVPVSLRQFVMLEPLIRRQEKVTQKVIAALCGCSVSQYEKKRARAKQYVVAIAKLAKKARDDAKANDQEGVGDD